MIANALVVEQDETLRETLRLVLQEEGYASMGVGDMDMARLILRASARPVVVLVGHGDPRSPDHSLVEELRELPPHAYVLLSTHPDRAPRVRNPHTRRFVPIVAEPCDLEALMFQIDSAAVTLDAALAPIPSGVYAAACG